MMFNSELCSNRLIVQFSVMQVENYSMSCVATFTIKYSMKEECIPLSCKRLWRVPEGTKDITRKCKYLL